MIPLLDLFAQHRDCEPDLSLAIAGVLHSSRFVLGPEVEAFEAEYAEVCGVEHRVGVANGTDALELAIRALGLDERHRVGVPAFTFAATALAVVRAGPYPVFVDVRRDTLLIDPNDPELDDVDAVIAVDLYGQHARLEGLPAGLPVIVDAAQSHGLRVRGWVAATSFYPAKNLGALGDGGAVLTDDPKIAESVRDLRNYGGAEKYRHDRLGFNSRLDELQAAVLRVKLARLGSWNLQRAVAAAIYDELLGDLDRVLTVGEHAHHLYVVRVPNRDRVLVALHDVGIGAGVHYPQALTDLPALRSYAVMPCPVAEGAAAEVLSLPLYPGITLDQQQVVVRALRTALSARP